MKARLLCALALLVILCSSGCNCINLADSGSGGGGRRGPRAINPGGGLLGDGYAGHHRSREYNGPQGPATAQVAYPYYTLRGPRDFLVNNPPSIGN